MACERSGVRASLGPPRETSSGSESRSDFAKTIFSGGLDFRKTETNFVFEFCPRGGGVWGGICAGFWILLRAGYFFQSSIIKCLALSSTTNFCFSFHFSFRTYSIGKVMEKLLPPATLESLRML